MTPEPSKEDLKRYDDINYYEIDGVKHIEKTLGNHEWVLLEDHVKALSALRASWEKEKARLQDHIDLMVDEFMRIKAISNSEIQGLCERAITTTKQHIPVIEQRDILQNGLDSMRAENQALEAEKKGLEERVRELESGILSIKIDFVGPAATHNLLCWICHKEPAVYDMNPNWCFRPCWNCQKEIKNARQ